MVIADIFENMNIPWTPRLILRTQPQPTQAQTPQTPQPEFCPRTIHVARAIIAHAVAPFPEAAKAISSAFLAYIRGQLTLDLTGDPPHGSAPAQHLP